MSRNNSTTRLVVYGLIALAIQSLAVILTLAFSERFGFSIAQPAAGDIKIYYRFAEPIRSGQVPYRDYLVEYPIMALPVFLMPLLAGGGVRTYIAAFLVEMMLFNGILFFLVAWRTKMRTGSGRVPAVIAWYTAIFLSICPLIVARFDLFPTLLCFLAALAMTSGRMGLGGFVAGLGFLTKIFPGAVMVPYLAMSGPWKPKLKALVCSGSVVLVGAFAWWWLGRDGMLQSLSYHGKRGLEIGSIPASAYMVAHTLFKTGVWLQPGYGSVNAIGRGAGPVAKLMPLLQVGLLLLVAWKSQKAKPDDGLRLTLAALLAFIVGSKVLSPQYMIWLIPFVLTLEGSGSIAARWLFLTCCVLSTMIYPYRMELLATLDSTSILILALRNLGVIGLFAVVLWRPATTRLPDPEQVNA